MKGSVEACLMGRLRWPEKRNGFVFVHKDVTGRGAVLGWDIW